MADRHPKVAFGAPAPLAPPRSTSELAVLPAPESRALASIPTEPEDTTLASTLLSLMAGEREQGSSPAPVPEPPSPVEIAGAVAHVPTEVAAPPAPPSPALAPPSEVAVAHGETEEPPSMEDFQRSLRNLHDRMENFRSRLASRETSVQQDLSKTRGDLALAVERAEALTAELVEERAKGSESAARARKFEEVLARQQDELRQGQLGIERLQAALAEALRSHEGVAQELAGASAERDHLREELGSAQSRVDAQRSQLAKAADLLLAARAELRRAQGEMSALRSLAQEARNEAEKAAKERDAQASEALRAMDEAEKAHQGRQGEAASRALAERQLGEARFRIEELERKVQAQRSLAEVPPPAAPTPVGGAPHPVGHLPCVPVGFVGADGRTMVKEAYFALGKGEALEQLLDSVLKRWGATRLPLLPHAGANDAFSLVLQGDPEHRSLRILRTGAFVLRLGREELADLGKLPTLVSRRAVGAHVSASPAPSGPRAGMRAMAASDDPVAIPAALPPGT